MSTRLTSRYELIGLSPDDFRAVAAMQLPEVTTSAGQKLTFSSDDIAWAQPLNAKMNEAIALVNSGSTHSLRRALDLLLSIFPIAPEYEMIPMAIGSTYAILGDKPKAREFLEKARAINPDNPHIKSNLEALATM